LPSVLCAWLERDGSNDRVPPNMRMKLSCRAGHSWWNAQGKPSFLIVAAAPRSLCAIR
jgi:hypothetical protein